MRFLDGDEFELEEPHTSLARVTRVPEAGHSVYFEKPDDFNFEVFRFLHGLSGCSA